MKIIYQLGSATLSIDDVTPEHLGAVIDAVTGQFLTPQDPSVFDTKLAEAEAVAEAASGGSLGEDRDPYDYEVNGNGNGSVLPAPQRHKGFTTELQHLEPANLDDDDALARIAFETWGTVAGLIGRWDAATPKAQEGWRAVAAAVRTAALLQQADRATADV